MTTNILVEEALIELHNVKGVTLTQVYNFIKIKNELESLSRIRIGLIKKHLKSLRETEDIVNKTGSGLSGHFKLANKSKFIKKRTNKRALKNINSKMSAKGRKETNSEINKLKKKPVISKQSAALIPMQVTPLTMYNNVRVSMFDTPMSSTKFPTSTPLINKTLIPCAPEVRKRKNKEKFKDVDLDTPRSSSHGKKRKLFVKSANVY